MLGILDMWVVDVSTVRQSLPLPVAECASEDSCVAESEVVGRGHGGVDANITSDSGFKSGCFLPYVEITVHETLTCLFLFYGGWSGITTTAFQTFGFVLLVTITLAVRFPWAFFSLLSFERDSYVFFAIVAS